MWTQEYFCVHMQVRLLSTLLDITNTARIMIVHNDCHCYYYCVSGLGSL